MKDRHSGIAPPPKPTLSYKTSQPVQDVVAGLDRRRGRQMVNVPPPLRWLPATRLPIVFAHHDGAIDVLGVTPRFDADPFPVVVLAVVDDLNGVYEKKNASFLSPPSLKDCRCIVWCSQAIQSLPGGSSCFGLRGMPSGNVCAPPKPIRPLPPKKPRCRQAMNRYLRLREPLRFGRMRLGD